MAKILIAGDFCPYHRISKMVADANYSFFDEIKDLTKSADYSIVNFECPVVEGDVKPIEKCGPALRTERNAVSAMKYAGFDCATLANNHFRDYGDAGCKTTIEELQKQNIDYVGGGLNLTEAQKILYKDLDGKRVAIVNFCENEFSIATETSAGAAPIDTVDNYNQITEARKNADYVLVIIHGGHEHYQLPSPRMKKLYRHYVDLGADAVVNHHQHCYSGYEYYNGKPIVYGLGNFCFDEGIENNIWNYGYMVNIDLNAVNITFEIIPYKQCNENEKVSLLLKDERISFDNKLSELNDIIGNDERLTASFEQLCSSREKWVKSIFNSYHNRYLNAAANRNLIKRPASKQAMRAIYNYIICEAHRDIVLNIIDKNYNYE